MDHASILIVEDDGLIAMHMTEMLERVGYKVMAPEYSGENAVSRIRSGPIPDVILMDIGLSGEMDGIQTAQEIRKLARVPIIFLTAYSDDSRIRGARQISSYGYLLKPCMEHDLVNAIENALGR